MVFLFYKELINPKVPACYALEDPFDIGSDKSTKNQIKMTSNFDSAVSFYVPRIDGNKTERLSVLCCLQI